MKLALILATEKQRIDIQPPLGLAYLAAYLSRERKFCETRIFPHTENITAKLKKFSPDLIGISCVTYDYPLAVKLAAEIREFFKGPVILGGIHISLIPGSLDKVFDFAVLGEGEETLAEIVGLFKEGELLNEETLRGLKGIAFYKDDEFCITPPRPFIEPLDSIPYPARELLRVERLTHMITSRGCPYRCAYCSSAKFWGKMRFFSAEYVVGEIEELIKKFKVKHVSFWDDLFIVNRPRLKRIVELIEERRLNKKVSFGCNVRANLVDEEICQLLQKMNVTRVSMGLESCSEEVLARLKGGNVSVGQNTKAVELCKQRGFITKASFIVGSPGETKADMDKTVKFIEESQLDGGGVFVATPYPGTDFWDYAAEKNIVNAGMDFRKLNPFYTEGLKSNILLTDEEVMSREDLNKVYLKINDLLSTFNARRGWRFRDFFSVSAILTAFKNPRAALIILWNIFKFRFLRAKQSAGVNSPE